MINIIGNIIGNSNAGIQTDPPVNSVLPTISGTLEIGESITTNNGSWINNPVSYSYQWKRNGISISSATSNTYILIDIDDGTDITVTVTATNSGGSTSVTSIESQIREFTNTNGEQAFLVVGDSIANGSNNTTGPGPTPSVGTVKQWNTSSIINITNADVYNIPAGGGTFIPKMGIDYNTASGRVPVFIPQGSSGAEFSPNGDNNNWSSTGTLRAIAESETTDCLTTLGVAKPKGIIVILGINDARAATTIGTVQTDIDAFFTWLTTTYPGVPIQVAQIGRTESVTGNSRIYTVRERIVSNAISKTDVNMCFNLGSWINSSGYGADLLHPTQTGNNNLGAALARWWSNLAYSKWTRSIISSMYGDITSGRKTLINNFVTTIGADLFDLENLHFLKVSDANDIGSDWTFLQLLHLNTGDVNLNTNLSCNGTDDSFESTYNPSIAILRASQNDLFTIAKIADNGAVGVRTLFGGSNTVFFRLTQGNIQYVVNDGTTTTAAGPITAFVDNTSYGIYRSGTTKGLLTNGVSTDNATVSSTGNINRNMRYGAFNNGALSQFGDFEYEWIVSGKFTTVDIASLHAALNTLSAGW